MSNNTRVSGVAAATVTETAILRSQVKDLQEKMDRVLLENEKLRRQVKALRDGVVLDEEP
jgi:cell division protein FtsB